MSNILENSHSELLSQLVDGELDSSNESSLYSELSNNENLRLEFRQLLKVKDSIKFDREAFDAPIDATVGLFSQLGFTSLFDSPDNNRAGAFNNQSKGFLSRRYLAPVLAGILACLISFGGLSYYYENKISDLKQTIAQMSSIEKQTPESVNNQTITNDNRGEISQKPQIIKPIKSIKRGFGSNVNNNINIIENSDNTQSVQSNQELKPEKIEKWLQNPNSDRLATMNSPNITQQYQGTYILLNKEPMVSPFNRKSLKGSSEIGYALQLRGMTGTSYPNVSDPIMSNVLFNNMSFGAYYTMGDNYMIGFEVGQEPIGQVFSNTKDGITSKVRQNPVIYWVGPSGRLIMNRINFLGGVQPYLQMTIGFTELGPLAKGIVGLQYLSESGIGAIFGLEGGYLQYKNQQNLYSSEKLGLTYGIFYKF